MKDEEMKKKVRKPFLQSLSEDYDWQAMTNNYNEKKVAELVESLSNNATERSYTLAAILNSGMFHVENINNYGYIYDILNRHSAEQRDTVGDMKREAEKQAVPLNWFPILVKHLAYKSKRQPPK